MPIADKVARPAVYSRLARALHWLTVALLMVQVPLGFAMVSYGSQTSFAPPTGLMYDSHKLLGLIVLALIVVRLAYRLIGGAPPPEPSLEPWQRVASGLTHWLLYALLLTVAALGWLATSYYGPMQPLGVPVPVLVAQDQAVAEVVYGWHKLGAIVLAALIGLHVAAALYHHLVRKDGVLRRMLPGRDGS
jgi:cytochrome b561